MYLNYDSSDNIYINLKLTNNNFFLFFKNNTKNPIINFLLFEMNKNNKKIVNEFLDLYTNKYTLKNKNNIKVNTNHKIILKGETLLKIKKTWEDKKNIYKIQGKYINQSHIEFLKKNTPKKILNKEIKKINKLYKIKFKNSEVSKNYFNFRLEKLTYQKNKICLTDYINSDFQKINNNIFFFRKKNTIKKLETLDNIVYLFQNFFLKEIIFSLTNDNLELSKDVFYNQLGKSLINLKKIIISKFGKKEILKKYYNKINLYTDKNFIYLDIFKHKGLKIPLIKNCYKGIFLSIFYENFGQNKNFKVIYGFLFYLFYISLNKNKIKISKEIKGLTKSIFSL